MKILILDDNEIIFGAPEEYYQDPHDYRKDTVVQVSHPNFFWEEFPKEDWDEIWLDHDLGLPGYNGQDVTREFSRRAFYGEKCRANFIILSMNPLAAQRMVSDLHLFSVNVKAIPISFMGDLGVSRGFLIKDRAATLRRN